MKWIRYSRIRPATLLVALSLVATANARIITVDDDAPADFNNIQAAIDDANNGDTVEIQPGTYTGEGNYNIRYNGKAITVRGTNPEDFDVVGATVIDCNSQGRGFIFESGELQTSVLSGLKITSAYGDYPGGGAIRCEEASPVISSCIIAGNCGSAGGGVYANYADPIVSDCIIIDNNAESRGGGLYIKTVDHAMIERCVIANNTAVSSAGGGLYHSALSTGLLTISKCVITGNVSLRYGGALCNRSMARIIACTITGNRSTSYGGGICTWYPISSQVAKSIISDSIIWDNLAPIGGPEIALIPQWDDDYVTTSVSFSNVRGGASNAYVGEYNCTLNWESGNIDTDPCFANSGHWDANGTPDDVNDDLWVDGEYHLKSQAGRWNANEGGWTTDEVTSLCLDAGHPDYPLGLEPFPNGGRINMGAYGGTAEASKSYFGKAQCETIVAGDINGDCIIDAKDFAFLGRNWLLSDPQPPDPWVPGRATNPNPPDGAIDPTLTTRLGNGLEWQAGLLAESHDVYFGTSSPGEFQGNQRGTVFLLNIPLTSGTYFWRIDEINAHGKTVGAVWSFSISPPEPASNPSPPDGAAEIFPDRGGMYLLQWEAGDRALSHDVYFGTVSPGEFQGNQTRSSFFSLGTTLLPGTYYWRVDEVSGDVKTTGAVWTFTTGPAP